MSKILTIQKQPFTLPKKTESPKNITNGIKTLKEIAVTYERKQE